MSLLNRGVSVAEIADRSGVSIGHMRNLVRKILAERAPAPPAEYLALQVSRLNEALLVSYSALHNSLTGTNWTRSIVSSGSCASLTAIMASPPLRTPARRPRLAATSWSRAAFLRPPGARSQ